MKLKVISIGDIHGRNSWKKIDVNKYDKIVFVGDYCDSYFYNDAIIYANLLDIIQLKKDYPDKIVLLLGNHDIQYRFLNEGFECSGFRPSMATNLNFIFKQEKDLFQIAYQIENFIWTHAGISTSWYDYNKSDIEGVAEKFDTKNLADTLNHMLLIGKENRLLHQVGRSRKGRYPSGGITWADRNETKGDYINDYHQIVGHTPIIEITKFGDEDGSITYIDVLGKAEQRAEEKKQMEKDRREMFEGYKDDEFEVNKLDKDEFDEEFPLTLFYEHEILVDAT